MKTKAQKKTSDFNKLHELAKQYAIMIDKPFYVISFYGHAEEVHGGIFEEKYVKVKGSLRFKNFSGKDLVFNYDDISDAIIHMEEQVNHK